MSKEAKSRSILILSILLAISLITAGYFGYYYFYQKKEIGRLDVELQNTKSDLEQMIEKSDTLSYELEIEKSKNSEFSGKIREIASTVGVLDRLSKTDRELLQKYSKVYFLNEHYVPDSLTTLPPDYLYESTRKMQIHEKVYPYLQDMISTAKKDGVDIKIISAYRSFGEQSSLKGTYAFTYGSGANKFSADQGYSEHQLGTTLDFTTPQTGSNFNAFESTGAFTWLKNNAYKYGFVLSYPEGNSYYQYEPWHWRFVGKKLAFRMHEEGENFYDLPQATIDNYLITIFE